MSILEHTVRGSTYKLHIDVCNINHDVLMVLKCFMHEKLQLKIRLFSIACYCLHVFKTFSNDCPWSGVPQVFKSYTLTAIILYIIPQICFSRKLTSPNIAMIHPKDGKTIEQDI